MIFRDISLGFWVTHVLLQLLPVPVSRLYALDGFHPHLCVPCHVELERRPEIAVDSPNP